MALTSHSPRWATVKVNERTNRTGWLRAAVTVTHSGRLGAHGGAGLGRRPVPVPSRLEPGFGPPRRGGRGQPAFSRGSTSSRSREPCAHLGDTRSPDSPELARRLQGNSRSTQTPARDGPTRNALIGWSAGLVSQSERAPAALALWADPPVSCGLCLPRALGTLAGCCCCAPLPAGLNSFAYFALGFYSVFNFVLSSVLLVHPELASNSWLFSCFSLLVAKVTGRPYHIPPLARTLYEREFTNLAPRSHQNKGIAVKDPEQVF